jgi:hypothetical protein
MKDELREAFFSSITGVEGDWGGEKWCGTACLQAVRGEQGERDLVRSG